ncbi:hypothetical protein QOZ80_5BG0423850 [Eleusine coracana subsp. coracana]|nr:hypothetical protein QOZ80_5BG0423850 [Eleusine coracana subsp. coracana]
MQRQMAATVEEQMMVKAIREESAWEALPKRIQAAVVTKEDWHRRIEDYCIRKRLPWNTCFARSVCKEGEYYEDMMRYLRKNLALYPYHLADHICRVMRISPFKYYCDVLFEAMKNEQPYDSIPNFSAADALRITGVGRNEFIDIMNRCRSKTIMWKLNKSIAKELLPAQPADLAIEPWWGVRFVNFTLDEFKKLSKEATSAIDKICKEEVNSYVLFDPEVISGLYRRGLVYFDVPVYPEDRFRVSRLEGFVSNKDQSYEDPIEELLYAVFVVSSENATVAELAATLQADLYQLQAAASFACRLGWAVKLLDADSVLRYSSSSALPSNLLSDYDDGLRLKSHAVTLYEAGKLGDSCIGDLCKDLASLEGKKFEGVLQEFANHAFSLRCFLECLLSGGTSYNETSDKLSEANSQECSFHEASDIPSADESIRNGVDNVDESNESSLRITESCDVSNQDGLSQQGHQMDDSDAAEVQPLSIKDLDETGNIITMDIPLPLKNADGSIASTVAGTNLPEKQVSNLILLLEGLSSKVELSTIGYLRLIRLYRNVKKQLRELCTEYQATGPTARLFNQRGVSKNNSPRKLVNIASGRWSPFHDPSTPANGGPARRQKCFTEVLSFDGNILRSYALTPVYEAATRSVTEEQPSTSPVAKPDQEDANTNDVALPGVNMIFDGAELHPFDIVACLQARQPLSLISEASAGSLAMK